MTDSRALLVLPTQHLPVARALARARCVLDLATAENSAAFASSVMNGVGSLLGARQRCVSEQTGRANWHRISTGPSIGLSGTVLHHVLVVPKPKLFGADTSWS